MASPRLSLTMTGKGSAKKNVGRGEEDPPDTTTLLLQVVQKLTDMIERNIALSDEIKALREKQAEHEKIQQQYEENQKSLLLRVQQLEEGSGNWSHVGGNVEKNDVMAIVNTVANELEQRKEKELNVVIYGLPEITNNNADDESDMEEEDAQSMERKEKQLVCKLLKEGLKYDASEERITRAFRLGKVRAPHEKPRPMKVYLDQAKTKQSVLDKRKSLSKFPAEHAYRKIFIRHDWTKIQRDIDFERRQAERNKNQTPSQPVNSDNQDRNRRTRPRNSQKKNTDNIH